MFSYLFSSSFSYSFSFSFSYSFSFFISFDMCQILGVPVPRQNHGKFIDDAMLLVPNEALQLAYLLIVTSIFIYK